MLAHLTKIFPGKLITDLIYSICAVCIRGIFWLLQDFNPSQPGVSPVVFLVLVGPTAFRSLTSFSSVVVVWFLSFSMIIFNPWGKILDRLPDQQHLMDIFCFPHFQIITQTVVTFSASILLMVPFQPCVDISGPWHLLTAPWSCTWWWRGWNGRQRFCVPYTQKFEIRSFWNWLIVCHLCAIGVHNQSVGTTIHAEWWRIKYPFPSVTYCFFGEDFCLSGSLIKRQHCSFFNTLLLSRVAEVSTCLPASH